MAYTKLPEKDAVLLVRALGLLMSQAGVYGPSHNVTQSAARSVFAELEQALKTFGPIEIARRESQIQVNGSSDGITSVTGKNLADRMALHKINGLLFADIPDMREFLRCVTLFGSPPPELAAQGGFEGALKNEGIRSLRVVTVAYQRVNGDEMKPPEKTEPPPVLPPSPALPSPTLSPPSMPRRTAGGTGLGVVDLSAAMMDDGSADDGPDGRANTAAEERSKRSAELAVLLRETAALIEKGVDLSDHKLDRIRSFLSDMMVGSEREISSLASQVNDDRQTIASIESAAKRRGIGLKLTRAELIERYAELNQEVMQPLTVSTGVIDMLRSGCVGPVSSQQKELLKLASESVERVNQLVAYMNRISGLPNSLTPDGAVVADSYR